LIYRESSIFPSWTSPVRSRSPALGFKSLALPQFQLFPFVSKSKGRHRPFYAEWHYIDLPFSTDGTPTVPAVESNALMELKEVQSVERTPEQMHKS